MSEPALLLVVAAIGLAGLALASFAALKGWRGWLDLKQRELAAVLPQRGPGNELAGLRERVRRLEAIADGQG